MALQNRFHRFILQGKLKPIYYYVQPLQHSLATKIQTNLLLCKTLATHTYATHLNPQKIGCREIVGFGINGENGYVDTTSFPFPAVRFQQLSPDILGLREKEKGDWRKLSIDEKKTLYRYSYCQTFAEMNAPSGNWKSIIGKALFWISVAIWQFILVHHLTHRELPESFTLESRKAQLKRMLDLEVNPILGLSSKWDYENECWK